MYQTLFHTFVAIYWFSLIWCQEKTDLETLHKAKYKTFLRSNPGQETDFRSIDNFNDGKVTKFVIPGYRVGNPLKVKDAIFQNEDDVERVVILDWSNYAEIFGGDTEAIATIGFLSVALDLCDKMFHVAENNGSSIKVYGHDFGAHIAGEASRCFKNRKGKKIDEIVAADPTSVHFDKNEDLALKCTDAENVTVIHTNADKFGWKKEVCGNDLWPYGGKQQPECETKPVFLKNKCSHEAAENRYIEYLEGKKATNQTKNVYVLCMDKSKSMRKRDRLMRSQSAAQRVIAIVPEQTYLGIVSFGKYATKAHNIIPIKSEDDRYSLMAVFPFRLEPATAIGSGLRLSMELINGIAEPSEKLCGTIILMTDGEHNFGEPPINCLKDLIQSCIRVDSIAMGSEASNDLETISAETGGNVYSIPENGGSKAIADTYQSFFDSLNERLPVGKQAVNLPKKTIDNNNSKTKGQVNNNNSPTNAKSDLKSKTNQPKARGKRSSPPPKNKVDVDFKIDKDVGLNTVFSVISENITKFWAILRSPNGTKYDVTSRGVFTLDDQGKEIQFFIADAEPGTWTLTLKPKNQANTMEDLEAVVNVKTYQRTPKTDSVRLNGQINNRTLSYPNPVIVSADLGYGQYPVIQADVNLILESEGLESPLTIKMLDNGAYPDKVANDGIYATAVNELPKPGRYTVTVIAKSNNQNSTKYVPKPYDYLNWDSDFCSKIECPTIADFEREKSLGSIKLDNTSLDIQPLSLNPITDLKVLTLIENQKLALLEWTEPGPQPVSSYNLTVSSKGLGPEPLYTFSLSDVQLGSLTNDSKSNPGDKKRVLVKVPDDIWNFGKHKLIDKSNRLELIFGLNAIDESGQSNEDSNPALGKIRQPMKMFEDLTKNSCLA